MSVLSPTHNQGSLSFDPSSRTLSAPGSITFDGTSGITSGIRKVVVYQVCKLA